MDFILRCILFYYFVALFLILTIVYYYITKGSLARVYDRALALGEFGGIALALHDHIWAQDDKNWGYESLKTSLELTSKYVTLVENLKPLIIESGLSASVYTQTTDVEFEINGLLTYDRKVLKVDLATVYAANSAILRVYPPP